MPEKQKIEDCKWKVCIRLDDESPIIVLGLLVATEEKMHMLMRFIRTEVDIDVAEDRTITLIPR